MTLLDAHHVQISMTENGDSRENPVAERVNGIIKNEYLAEERVTSLAQAQIVSQQSEHLYNYQRPHLSCDMLVPDKAHKGEGKLKRRWQNYYHKKVMTDILANEKPD